MLAKSDPLRPPGRNRLPARQMAPVGLWAPGRQTGSGRMNGLRENEATRWCSPLPCPRANRVLGVGHFCRAQMDHSWRAPRRVAHKSRFNQNENRTPAHSWTRKTLQASDWALPGRFLVAPDWPDFRSLRSRARRADKEMKHRRPHGRSPPLGQLYLTHVDQSVNI